MDHLKTSTKNAKWHSTAIQKYALVTKTFYSHFGIFHKKSTILPCKGKNEKGLFWFHLRTLLELFWPGSIEKLCQKSYLNYNLRSLMPNNYFGYHQMRNLSKYLYFECDYPMNVFTKLATHFYYLPSNNIFLILSRRLVTTVENT